MQKLEQKKIIELIADYLTGQLKEDQVAVLKCWLEEDDEHKKYFDDMREVWLASSLAYPVEKFNKEVAYQWFTSRIAQREKRPQTNKEVQPVYIWMTRIAAAIIVGFLFGAFYVYWTKVTPNSQLVSQYETIVPLGSKSYLVLADGTKVWLNAGSKFRYATDFGQTSREVYLEGEAYFDVAHDTTKIFIVKTDKIDIKALGTSFNVKAYPGEEHIETVLVNGKVTIGQLVMSPNEKCVYTRKNELLIIEKKASKGEPNTVQAKSKPQIVREDIEVIETSIDPVIYTSWKDKQWKIERETLESIAVQLERRYDVKIRFADKSARSLNISAVIKDESLEQVLRFIQLSVPIDFEINGKVVVLKEDRLLKEKYKAFYKQE